MLFSFVFVNKSRLQYHSFGARSQILALSLVYFYPLRVIPEPQTLNHHPHRVETVSRYTYQVTFIERILQSLPLVTDHGFHRTG